MMRLIDVAAQVVEITDLCKTDPETAHLKEDRLYKEVLEAIANGNCDNPGSCARQALMTQALDFVRHCS